MLPPGWILLPGRTRRSWEDPCLPVGKRRVTQRAGASDALRKGAPTRFPQSRGRHGPAHLDGPVIAPCHRLRCSERSPSHHKNTPAPHNGARAPWKSLETKCFLRL